MKVILINNLYYPNVVGGAEISVQIVAEDLIKNGYEVIVFTISDKEDIQIMNGVKVYYTKYCNLYWFIKSKKYSKFKRLLWHFINFFNISILKKLQYIIKQEKPDIAHTNNLYGMSNFIWYILSINKIPIVHTIRDYYLLCRKSTLYTNNKNCDNLCKICKLYSNFNKLLSKKINSVAGISNFILNCHKGEKFFQKSESIVIYNSINIVKCQEKKRVNTPLVFAYVGLLSPSKGIEFLLNIFQNNISFSKLFVFGIAETEDVGKSLKNKYQSEKIQFFGYKNINEIFPQIDVLIVPSLWQEPFSRVIIEANSFGIPVIASNKGGIPEIIIEGKTGFLFDPYKKGDLEEKIEFIYKNPHIILSMSKNCLENIKYFDSSVNIKKYIELYEKTLLAQQL